MLAQDGVLANGEDGILGTARYKDPKPRRGDRNQAIKVWIAMPPIRSKFSRTHLIPRGKLPRESQHQAPPSKCRIKPRQQSKRL